MKTYMFRLALAVLCLAGASDCKSHGTTNIAVDAGCDTPRDEIRVALAALPNTLDWSRSNETSWVNYPVVHAMMRGLTALDQKNEPVASLASSWTVSMTKDVPPRQVYTFHLRKGVLWSDGKTPLVAKDFVTGWRRAMEGNEPAELSDILGVDAVIAAREKKGSSDADERRLVDAALKSTGVEAVDDATLQVTLKAPKSYFLSRIAYVYPFFPVPSADLEGLKTEAEIRRYFDEPSSGKPMVLGAFQVDSWDRVAQTIRLVQNSHDFDAPSTGAVKRLAIVQADLSPVLYDQCKIDFLAMDDPATLKDPPADLAKEPLLSTFWLGMNSDRLDLPLRRAISFALNRGELTRGILPSARAAFGFLPTDLPGAVAPGDPLAKDFPTFDLEKAKTLLATSKYKGEELTLLVRNSGTFLPETGIADAIRKQLADAGIKVTLVTTSNFSNDIKGANGLVRHDLFLRRLGADYAHPQTFFTAFQPDGNNNTGFEKIDGGSASRELEVLLAEGAARTDAPGMKATYTKAQALLLVKYAVLVPIYYPDRYYRKRTWIEGLGVDPFNFFTFRSMRVKSASAVVPAKP